MTRIWCYNVKTSPIKNIFFQCFKQNYFLKGLC